jgi:hypothetical protein
MRGARIVSAAGEGIESDGPSDDVDETPHTSFKIADAVVVLRMTAGAALDGLAVMTVVEIVTRVRRASLVEVAVRAFEGSGGMCASRRSRYPTVKSSPAPKRATSLYPYASSRALEL